MDARTDSSRRLARAVGAAIGLLVGGIPVALEHVGAPFGGPLFGMDGLWAIGLAVGPLLGAAFGPSVRPHDFQFGLAIGMAILAVVVGDVLFVTAAFVAEGPIELETLAAVPIVVIYGLVIVGPVALIVTSTAAVAWQLLVRVVLRVAVGNGGPVGSRGEARDRRGRRQGVRP